MDELLDAIGEYFDALAYWQKWKGQAGDREKYRKEKSLERLIKARHRMKDLYLLADAKKFHDRYVNVRSQVT